MTNFENKGRSNNFLRTISVLLVLLGAALSAILTIIKGHKNTSIILPALFLIWVLSPFIMLLIANANYNRYAGNGRVLQYLLMFFIPIFSVIAYSGIVSPVGAKPAAVFLFVPFISWLLIIAFLIIRSKTTGK
jgi:hypothetical protein